MDEDQRRDETRRGVQFGKEQAREGPLAVSSKSQLPTVTEAAMVWLLPFQKASAGRYGCPVIGPGPLEPFQRQVPG